MARWCKMTDENGQTEYALAWGGFSTKHYMTEHEQYTAHYERKYPTPQEANKYVKKILRHFKISATCEFCNDKNGQAMLLSNHLRFPRQNISLGLICHEIAHLLAFRKYGDCNHNRCFRSQNKRAMNWAKRYL